MEFRGFRSGKACRPFAARPLLRPPNPVYIFSPRAAGQAFRACLLGISGQRFYTSAPAMRWRALRQGERVDTGFSFKGVEQAARASWKSL
eukprot:7433016-Pyramimonas_sp.AAC.1